MARTPASTAYIIDAVRTPVGKRGGSLARSTRPTSAPTR